AWRAAAPLSDPAPIDPGAGDRVVIGSAGNGPPLVLLRRVGRGQALLVNGTGLWRWSLSGHDDLTEERGRRLWRGFVHWLAEPVQGEPLRVRPERWLTTRGETVHLFATLQDGAFRPIADAVLAGEAQHAAGRTSRLEFVPRATGSDEATLEDPRPGRYRLSVRAARGGRGPERDSRDARKAGGERVESSGRCQGRRREAGLGECPRPPSSLDSRVTEQWPPNE